MSQSADDANTNANANANATKKKVAKWKRAATTECRLAGVYVGT